MNIKVGELIGAMGDELKSLLRANGVKEPLMVGIHTGGAWIAEQLHALLGVEDPLGTLDISFYRDDFSRVGMNPKVKPSDLPLSVEARHIILVDDVLFTGRTIRAALNEIFDYGRPASIMLAVLIDRGGRELPIEASVVGRRLELGCHEHAKLSGPEPLELRIVRTPGLELPTA